MKRVLAACAIMLTLLLGSMFVLYDLHRSLRTVEEALTAARSLTEEQHYDEAIVLLEAAAESWEKREHTLAKLLRHKELETITQNLVALPLYLRYGDYSAFHGTLAQTHLLLRHVWEAELPRLENLLKIKKLPQNRSPTAECLMLFTCRGRAEAG